MSRQRGNLPCARSRIMDGVRRAVPADRQPRAEAQRVLNAGRVAMPVDTDLIATFAARISAHGAKVLHVDRLEAVLDHLAEYLGAVAANPAAVATGDDQRLDALPWRSTPALGRVCADAARGGGVSLSMAERAIAETGSVLLYSGRNTPSSLNYLAERHVVLVPVESVVASLDEALAAAAVPALRPRARHIISGPSGTADVALTYVSGVHGPAELLVLLIGSS